MQTWQGVLQLPQVPMKKVRWLNSKSKEATSIPAFLEVATSHIAKLEGCNFRFQDSIARSETFNSEPFRCIGLKQRTFQNSQLYET